MTRALAVLEGSEEEILIYPVTREADILVAYPNMAGGGLWPNPSEATLVDFPRLVWVYDDERPALEFGDTLQANAPRRDPDGVWRRGWTVVPPDAARTAELKEDLAELARHAAERKRAAMFQGARPYELSVRLQTYQEVAQYDSLPGTPTPNPLNFPLLAPLAQARGTTLQQEMASVRAESHAWWTGAAQIEVGLEATVSAIMAAASAPEAKAVLDAFADDD